MVLVLPGGPDAPRNGTAGLRVPYLVLTRFGTAIRFSNSMDRMRDWGQCILRFETQFHSQSGLIPVLKEMRCPEEATPDQGEFRHAKPHRRHDHAGTGVSAAAE